MAKKSKPGKEAAKGELELLARINKAVAAANEAEQTVVSAKAELVSRSKTIGLLLLEAKKLHPAVKDFEVFLKKVQGLKLSRAYDLLRLAGGRTTDEELKKDARERKQRSRAVKKSVPPPRKAPRQIPALEPVPELSVTDQDVTESSAVNLCEFIYACETHLPKLNKANLKMARDFVNEWCSKAEAA